MIAKRLYSVMISRTHSDILRKGGNKEKMLLSLNSKQVSVEVFTETFQAIYGIITRHAEEGTGASGEVDRKSRELIFDLYDSTCLI